MLSMPLYFQSIHNKEFERNLLHLHTAGSYSSCVRMFTRHTLDVQPSVLNCECSSWTASISDGFHCSVSSCSLPVVGQFSYIWNDQHTSEQHNKENSLPTSICAFSWHADSRKRNTPTVAWFQASNAVWMRSALFSDFTQRRLVVYCRRFGLHLQGQQSKAKALRSTNVRNPSPVDRA